MSRRLMTVAVAWLLPTAMSAMFRGVETKKVPVQRLAENIERQLTQKPDDIELRLNLARLYAMAYAQKVTEFAARSTGGDNLQAWFGAVPPYVPGPVKSVSNPEVEQRAAADLSRAISTYEDVVKRAPENFVAHLGLAWALEQAGRSAEAVSEYRKVVTLAWPVEQKSKGLTGSYNKPATAEAAERLRALLDPARDAQELASLREKVRELERQPRAITPIAIPLGVDVSAPLDRDARVIFDADGSGIPRRWTWIDKNAGWLVYDADGTGEITSALQWFGSVTFWLFWSNGYHALGALDDDGDGELRGEELRNLAIWHDRNQNGVSEKREVRSLAAHSIAALSCTYQSGDGVDVAAYSPRGALFADGTTRPSYDVILRSRGSAVTMTAPLH